MNAIPSQESLACRAADAFSRYRDGDVQRLGDLVDLLTPLMWHTARAQGASVVTAEDVLQIAWVQLIDSADRIVEPQAVLAWLIVTVKRETWRQLRRSRSEVDVDEQPEPRSQTPDPEVLTVLKERQKLLWLHVAELPARCQELLRVIAFADRPDYAAIATALGMPMGSIGPTRGRCLQKLRTALDNDPAWEA